MNRAHSVIAGACSWLAGHTGALIVGVAVVWMTAAPSPMWGQWSGTNPVWTNSNVGIGTTNPSAFTGYTVLGIENPANGGVLDMTRAGTRFGSLYYSSGLVLEVPNATMPMRFLLNGAERVHVDQTGNVGIGTTNPQYKLAVNGNIGAQDIIVTNTGWSDYVFRPGYRLRPLSEVSQFIRANGHLPEIPTEAEVKEKGVSLGDMQAKLLAKVEELTLHAIQQEKESRELRENLTRENQELRDRLARLEKGAASLTTTAAK